MKITIAAQESGVPRGTVKNRVLALKKNPDHPDRQHLRPSAEEYRDIVSRGAQIDEWLVHRTLVGKWKRQHETKVESQSGGVEEQTATPSSERELIDVLKDQLKLAHDLRREREEMYREELTVLREAMAHVKETGTRYFDYLKVQNDDLKKENERLKALTAGTVKRTEDKPATPAARKNETPRSEVVDSTSTATAKPDVVDATEIKTKQKAKKANGTTAKKKAPRSKRRSGGVIGWFRK